MADLTDSHNDENRVLKDITVICFNLFKINHFMHDYNFMQKNGSFQINEQTILCMVSIIISKRIFYLNL